MSPSGVETSNMGLLLAILLTTIFLGTSRLLFRSVLAPLGVLGVIWGLSIGMYSLRLIPYELLHSDTWFAIGLSLFGFFAGSATANLMTGLSQQKGLRPELRPKVTARALSASQKQFLRRSIVLVSSLALLGSVLYVHRIVSYYGLDFILANPTVVRFELVFPGEGLDFYRPDTYLRGLISAGAVLSGFYLRVVSLRFLPGYLAFIAAAIRDFGFLGRSEIISAMFLYLVAGYLGQRVFLGISRVSFGQIRRWVLAVGLVVIIIFPIGDLLGKHELESSFATSREVLGFPIPSFLLSVSNRLAGPLPALDDALQEDDSTRFWGIATFYPLSRVVERLRVTAGAVLGSHDKEGLPVVEYTSDTRFVPTPINTYTWLRYFYDDFGFMGVLLVPYLVGFAASYLWVKLHARRSVVLLIMVSLLYNVIFYSYGEWRLWNIYFVFGAFIAIVIGVMIDGRRWEVNEARYFSPEPSEGGAARRAFG